MIGLACWLLRLELARCERALDRAYDAQVSARIDGIVAALEALQ